MIQGVLELGRRASIVWSLCFKTKGLHSESCFLSNSTFLQDTQLFHQDDVSQLVRCSTSPFASGREMRLQRGLNMELMELGRTRQKAEMVRGTPHSNMPVTSNTVKCGPWGVLGWIQTRKILSGYNVMEFTNQYFTPHQQQPEENKMLF